MTESAKTSIFVAAAAVSLLIAFSLGPRDVSENVDELVGTRLNQFEVDVAKRLKIVKFDKDTATTSEFEVAESDGSWTIPSKQNYPADATEQMATAATCLIDREVLRIAGTTAVSHDEFGVIDPSGSKLDSKAEGVGTRVTITDSNDESLADLVIGKPVKDAAGQYYVRNADQDIVYVVNLEPEKLTTKFEDWIEKDLLQLNPLDISRVDIKDYSVEMQPILTANGISMQVGWDRRGEMTLSYDSKESKWVPERLQQFDQQQKEMTDFQLAEDEELNEDNLRQLRSGLDELLLVDVERKPAGLSSDLKAGSDFLKNQEAASSLVGRGFAPIAQGPDAPAEILSTEGEIVCTLKNGVEYVLRFGNLQIGENGETGETADATGTDEADQDSTDDGVNRFLFVMARFNEGAIDKPELEALPELPAATEEATTEESTTEESSDEEETTTEESSEESATPDETSDDEQPAAEETAEAETAEGESADTETAEPAETEATDEPSADDERAKLVAERERIEKENERKQNEYNDQVEAGRKRVEELNERFGDWYYVISNSVYEKIHLSRDDVIRKKEAEAAETETADPPAGLPGLPNLPFGGVPN